MFKHAILAGLLCAFGGIETACAQKIYAPAQTTVSSAQTPGYVAARDFLGPQYMESRLHRVHPDAYNNGYSNIYRIETPGHVFTVQGTQQARTRIHEIEATHRLRQTSTPEAIVNSAVHKTGNLVETPYRAVKTVAHRASHIETPKDAVLFIPNGVGEIAGNLASGVGELAITGARIAKGATGTKCSPLDCVGKAGKDIWSGTNSILGKHDAARKFHASVGTDPETDNPVLRRQINRLAYAHAYTGAVHEFGLGGAGIAHLSSYSKGVGYFNNAEFVGQYEDAYKTQKYEKDLLARWGVAARTVDTLYANPVFTKKMRTDLVAALSVIADPRRVYLTQMAANADTRYNAQRQISAYQYVASMGRANHLGGILKGTPDLIAITPNGALVFPVVADYLQWTPGLAAPVDYLAGLSRTGRFRAAELHVIGAASPEVRQNSEKQGVRVVEVR